MKKVTALLLVANSVLAQEIVIVNQSYPYLIDDSNVSVVVPVDTKGPGVVEEICYRGLLFLKHKDMNSTGGLAQVFDPLNAKPVQCSVKE